MKNLSLNLDNRVTLLHEPLNGKNFGPNQPQFFTKYNNLIIKKKYKWCAFIDVDEFIVLKKHDNIKNFLKYINFDRGALGINWVLFGNNNHIKYEEKPVIKRFTKSSNIPDKHIKSIINTNDILDFYNPHNANLINGNQINEKSKIYQISPWQENSSVDFIQINHYIIKSNEEYNYRTNKHHCRIEEVTVDKHFNAHNKNNIENLYAYNLLMSNLYFTNLNKIDYEFYIQFYDDLLINGVINEKLAYDHFKYNGIKEKRICNLNFDFNYYKKNNYDLKNLTNIELWNHFKNNGINEKRKFTITNT